MQRRRNRWHMCCRHETNQYLLSKQGMKQIPGTMTCSKSLGLSKQGNTNSTCAVDVEQIIIWLANRTVNKRIKIMTCSNSTANASGSCKRNNTDGVCWWHWTNHYVVETYAMTFSLLKVIYRGVWLGKLTYPVTYRLTLNKSDLRCKIKYINSCIILWLKPS